MGKLIEGLWDCPFCDNKRIKAGQKTCPLCGIFHPNSVAVARYGALIRAKYTTNCDAHLAESLFQTRSSAKYGKWN